VTKSSLHDELETVSRIRAGDVEAFSSLFRQYYEPLCFFGVRYLHDLQSAEGIVQDIFVRLWESRETLGIQSSLKSYLYASVRNACLNQLKHDGFSTPLDDEADRPDTEGLQPDLQLESTEIGEALTKAINTLAPRCRQIFAMAKYDDLSYQEIAEILDISVNTVKTQLKRALKTLSIKLQHFQMLFFFTRWW
jgi:RNA polymerase sigma-70 factor (ECF subfamily)